MRRMVFLVILAFISCTDKQHFRSALVNAESKDYSPYVIQISTLGGDFSTDTTVLALKQIGDSKDFYCDTITGGRAPDMLLGIKLINIDDTTSFYIDDFKYNDLYMNIFSDKIDSVLAKHIQVSIEQGCNEKEEYLYNRCFIKLSKELSRIMQKDYNLMEQYPEYYSVATP